MNRPGRKKIWWTRELGGLLGLAWVALLFIIAPVVLTWSGPPIYRWLGLAWATLCLGAMLLACCRHEPPPPSFGDRLALACVAVILAILLAAWWLQGPPEEPLTEADVKAISELVEESMSPAERVAWDVARRRAEEFLEEIQPGVAAQAGEEHSVEPRVPEASELQAIPLGLRYGVIPFRHLGLPGGVR